MSSQDSGFGAVRSALRMACSRGQIGMSQGTRQRSSITFLKRSKRFSLDSLALDSIFSSGGPMPMNVDKHPYIDWLDEQAERLPQMLGTVHTLKVRLYDTADDSGHLPLQSCPL